jgi:hypothetical protein
MAMIDVPSTVRRLSNDESHPALGGARVHSAESIALRADRWKVRNCCAFVKCFYPHFRLQHPERTFCSRPVPTYER